LRLTWRTAWVSSCGAALAVPEAARSPVNAAGRIARCARWASLRAIDGEITLERAEIRLGE